MNIVVVGGGAVGSLVATDLARAGEEVTLLVRPQAMPPTGTLKTQVAELGHEARWAILPVISTLTEAPDLVILCVKAPDFMDAAGLLSVASASPILALHAAPMGDALLASALGRAVTGGVFLGSAEYGQAGQTQVARPRVALAADAPQSLRDLCARALPTETATDLAATRWALALVDLPSALAALVNHAWVDLAGDRTAQGISITLLMEASRVFAKAGIAPANLPETDLARLRKLHSVPGIFVARAVHQESALFQRRGSLPLPLLQSLRRQRPTEIDALYGELARLGARHGVPTPTIARLVEVAQGIERTGTFIAADKLKQALRTG